MLTSIARRYSENGQTVAFNDFIMVITKVAALMGEKQQPLYWAVIIDGTTHKFLDEMRFIILHIPQM